MSHTARTKVAMSSGNPVFERHMRMKEDERHAKILDMIESRSPHVVTSFSEAHYSYQHNLQNRKNAERKANELNRRKDNLLLLQRLERIAVEPPHSILTAVKQHAVAYTANKQRLIGRKSKAALSHSPLQQRIDRKMREKQERLRSQHLESEDTELTNPDSSPHYTSVDSDYSHHFSQHYTQPPAPSSYSARPASAHYPSASAATHYTPSYIHPEEGDVNLDVEQQLQYDTPNEYLYRLVHEPARSHDRSHGQHDDGGGSDEASDDSILHDADALDDTASNSASYDSYDSREQRMQHEREYTIKPSRASSSSYSHSRSESQSSFTNTNINTDTQSESPSNTSSHSNLHSRSASTSQLPSPSSSVSYSPSSHAPSHSHSHSHSHAPSHSHSHSSQSLASSASHPRSASATSLSRSASHASSIAPSHSHHSSASSLAPTHSHSHSHRSSFSSAAPSRSHHSSASSLAPSQSSVSTGHRSRPSSAQPHHKEKKHISPFMLFPAPKSRTNSSHSHAHSRSSASLSSAASASASESASHSNTSSASDLIYDWRDEHQRVQHKHDAAEARRHERRRDVNINYNNERLYDEHADDDSEEQEDEDEQRDLYPPPPPPPPTSSLSLSPAFEFTLPTASAPPSYAHIDYFYAPPPRVHSYVPTIEEVDEDEAARAKRRAERDSRERRDRHKNEIKQALQWDAERAKNRRVHAISNRRSS